MCFLSKTVEKTDIMCYYLVNRLMISASVMKKLIEMIFIIYFLLKNLNIFLIKYLFTWIYFGLLWVVVDGGWWLWVVLDVFE